MQWLGADVETWTGKSSENDIEHCNLFLSKTQGTQ